MSNQNAVKLTQVTFFKAAQALKKNRQEFLDKRPTMEEAAVMLAKHTGFPISGASISSLMEATGIKWNSRKNTRGVSGSERSVRDNAVVTLTRAVNRLYDELGIDKTKGFLALVNYAQQRYTAAMNELPKDEEATPNPPDGGEVVS